MSKNIIDMQGKITWLQSEKGEQAVHDAVVAYLAGLRAGTACTKTRSEVRGGGRKPFKQKGTGRARAGSIRSNIWTGGGVAFGPKPRSYAKGINKKVKQLALQHAFTKRFEAGEVTVVEDITFDAPKTKLAADFLADININERVVVIVNDSVDTQEDVAKLDTISKSFGNLANVYLTGALGVNTYEMLLGKNVVITKDALEVLGSRVAKETK